MNDENNLETERDYYKFYKDMYEERYHTWKSVAVTLIVIISYIVGFTITYFLLAK